MYENYLHVNEKDKFKTIYNSNYNNKTNLRGSFPNWTKSKQLTVSQLVLQLQTSRVNSHSTLSLLSAFHTSF